MVIATFGPDRLIASPPHDLFRFPLCGRIPASDRLLPREIDRVVGSRGRPQEQFRARGRSTYFTVSTSNFTQHSDLSRDLLMYKSQAGRDEAASYVVSYVAWKIRWHASFLTVFGHILCLYVLYVHATSV